MKLNFYACLATLILSLSGLSAEEKGNKYPDNTWLGKSKDWNAVENWSTGKVPTAVDKHNVVLPGACENYPVIEGDISVNGVLKIEKDAKLTTGKGNISSWDPDPGTKAGVINKGNLNVTSESIFTVGCGGFKNEGTVDGTPQLVFKYPYYNAELLAGKASFESITMKDSVPSYIVSLMDDTKIAKNLILEGGGFNVNKDVTLTIQGDLVFNGSKKQTAAMTLFGSAFLHGNVVGNESAICGGTEEKSGGGWLVLAGNGDQEVRSSSTDGTRYGGCAYAEGWRRHNHMGYCAPDFAPLQALLSDIVKPCKK